MAKSGIKHIDVGSILARSEWESEETHELIHGNAFPSSPVERQLFYRDDEHKLYQFDGTNWVCPAAGGLSESEADSKISDHAALSTGTHGGGIGDADGDTRIQCEESADEDKIRMDVKGIEAFLLHDDGILDLAKQSGCRVYRTGANQLIPSDSNTVYDFDTKRYDIQNEFDLTNNRFVAKKAGYYIVTGWCRILNLADGNIAGIGIWKNGNYFCINQVAIGVAFGPRIAVAVVVDLAANDYIDMRIFHTYGADREVQNGEFNTGLSIHKIG